LSSSAFVLRADRLNSVWRVRVIHDDGKTLRLARRVGPPKRWGQVQTIARVLRGNVGTSDEGRTLKLEDHGGPSYRADQTGDHNTGHQGLTHQTLPPSCIPQFDFVSRTRWTMPLLLRRGAARSGARPRSPRRSSSPPRDSISAITRRTNSRRTCSRKPSAPASVVTSPGSLEPHQRGRDQALHGDGPEFRAAPPGSCPGRPALRR